MNAQQQDNANPGPVSRLLDFDGVRHPKESRSEILQPELGCFLKAPKKKARVKPLRNFTGSRNTTIFVRTDVGLLRQIVVFILAAALVVILLFILNKRHPMIISDAKTFWNVKFANLTSAIQQRIHNTSSAWSTSKSKYLNTDKSILKGIIFNDTQSSALIGSNLFRKGDLLAGATIVNIQSDYIEFESVGKKWKRFIGQLSP